MGFRKIYFFWSEEIFDYYESLHYIFGYYIILNSDIQNDVKLIPVQIIFHT